MYMPTHIYTHTHNHGEMYERIYTRLNSGHWGMPRGFLREGSKIRDS